jgi:hypothetical protein
MGFVGGLSSPQCRRRWLTSRPRTRRGIPSSSRVSLGLPARAAVLNRSIRGKGSMLLPHSPNSPPRSRARRSPPSVSVAPAPVLGSGVPRRLPKALKKAVTRSRRAGAGPVRRARRAPWRARTRRGSGWWSDPAPSGGPKDRDPRSTAPGAVLPESGSRRGACPMGAPRSQVLRSRALPAREGRAASPTLATTPSPGAPGLRGCPRRAVTLSARLASPRRRPGTSRGIEHVKKLASDTGRTSSDSARSTSPMFGASPLSQNWKRGKRRRSLPARMPYRVPSAIRRHTRLAKTLIGATAWTNGQTS